MAKIIHPVINLSYEISLFKKSPRFPTKSLFLKNRADIQFGVEKAFHAACNRRKGSFKTWLDKEKEAPLIKIFLDFFANPISTTNSFSKCFEDAISETISELKAVYLGITKNECEGRSQKLVTMAFKYFRCYDDYSSVYFSDCYMPIDGLTLQWCNSFLSTNTKAGLKMIKTKNKWTEMNRILFDSIQKEIKTHLSTGSRIDINHSKNKLKISSIVLPTNSLDAEFIVWHQEKINSLRKEIEKSKLDYWRIGIEEI